jgi:hypothetical protein
VLASGFEGAISMRLGTESVSSPHGFRQLSHHYWTHFPKQPLGMSVK